MSEADSTAECSDVIGPDEIYESVRDEVSDVIVGNDDAIEKLTISLLTGGHLLLEGVPGVAKTTIANTFARAVGLDNRRIQMTPDILPADITGTNVYRENTGEFELKRGPIFTNLVIADEINRATPKTQSALLEAMEERHVTIEGDTLALPEPFMVVATQNPIEMEGVFELPEAQRDRFQFKLSIELPDQDVERQLLDQFDEDPDLNQDAIEQVIDVDAVFSAREVVKDTYVAPAIKEYLTDLITYSRTHPDVEHGASPRATLMFLNAVKAQAAIAGRDYVIPDDIKSLAPAILSHRLVLQTDAELRSRQPQEVVIELLDSIEPPSAEAVTPDDH